MANSYFQFKKFLVRQDKCAMKVGTDGVLLGAWADISNTSHILDIGTGSGLIALMVAQRSHAHITAIDISKQACAQAQENIDISPWKKRISVFHTLLQEFEANTNHKFDLIVCNPPFFEKSKEMIKTDRVLARQNISMTFEDLTYHTSQLIDKSGRFCVILPFNLKEYFSSIAASNQLFCNKELIITPAVNKPPIRILMEFSKRKTKKTTSGLTIETDKRHHYTKEYISLTKDFYLNF